MTQRKPIFFEEFQLVQVWIEEFQLVQVWIAEIPAETPNAPLRNPALGKNCELHAVASRASDEKAACIMSSSNTELEHTIHLQGTRSKLMCTVTSGNPLIASYWLGQRRELTHYIC